MKTKRRRSRKEEDLDKFKEVSFEENMKQNQSNVTDEEILETEKQVEELEKMIL